MEGTKDFQLAFDHEEDGSTEVAGQIGMSGFPRQRRLIQWPQRRAAGGQCWVKDLIVKGSAWPRGGVVLNRGGKLLI